MATRQKKTSKKTKTEKESALAAFSFDKLVPPEYVSLILSSLTIIGLIVGFILTKKQKNLPANV